MNARILEKGDWLFIGLRPVKAWAYWLFGLLFVVLGVWVAFLLGRGIRLTCEADAKGGCELARVTVIGWRSESFPVAELTGARTQSVTAGGVARTDLVLESVSGDRAIPLVAADGAEKGRLAGQVQRFVADPAAGPLDIREDGRPFGIPLGLFVAAAGLAMILAMERVVLVADRSAGTLFIRSRRFFIRQSREVRLNEIEEVSTPTWRVRGAESSSVVLHLAGGREVSLTRTPLFTAGSAARVVEVLRRFLAPGQPPDTAA